MSQEVEILGAGANLTTIETTGLDELVPVKIHENHISLSPFQRRAETTFLR